jgi:predicted RNase H-like HicB family nuclease
LRDSIGEIGIQSASSAKRSAHRVVGDGVGQSDVAAGDGFGIHAAHDGQVRRCGNDHLVGPLSVCAKSSRAVRRKVANLADRAAKSSLRRVSQSLRLTIVFEPDAGGWIVASVPEVPGALSQGRTREEARENVIDALHGILELRFCEHALAEPAQDSESLELRIAA